MSNRKTNKTDKTEPGRAEPPQAGSALPGSIQLDFCFTPTKVNQQSLTMKQHPLAGCEMK